MTKLAPLITGFLRDYMPRQRGYSPQSCETYAYCFKLLFDFVAKRLRIRPSFLTIEDLDAPMIVAFLNHIEQDRGNGAATRNQADQIPWPQKVPAACPISAVKSRLRSVGLRPTRQRMALGWLLFAKGDRHVSAEMLYEEALRAREPLSLATVYNTLRQFSEAGLLRQVSVSGPKTFFDTNVSEHHHFYNEDDETVTDIPGSMIQVCPTTPCSRRWSTRRC